MTDRPRLGVAYCKMLPYEEDVRIPMFLRLPPSAKLPGHPQASRHVARVAMPLCSLYNRAVILFAIQKTQDEQVSIEMTSLSSKEKLTGLAQILAKFQALCGIFSQNSRPTCTCKSFAFGPAL